MRKNFGSPAKSLFVFLSLAGALWLQPNTAGAAQDFQSFYQFSPPPNVINGVRYPRNGMTLFRGTDDGQMDLARAIRAMSGDASAPVESKYFSTIKYQLMKKPFSLAVQLPRPVSREVEKEIAANQGQALSEEKAVSAAARIVDDSFEFYKNQNTLEGRYLNYNSGSWVDWPSDVVFTTINSPVSATYGNRILVIKEKTPRSIDLNYYNKVLNNKWYDHARDAGEFSAHGYLPAQDIVGYQLRTGQQKAWHRIELALYKRDKMILVFDGDRSPANPSSCMDENPDTGLVSHCDYRPGSIVTAPPRITQDLARLAGVIVACKSGICDEPETAAIARYPLGDADKAAGALKNAIEGLKKQGREFRFIDAKSMTGMR